MNKDKTITTSNGAVFPNDGVSISAGKNGPLTFDNFRLFEKLAHFNRERIPERVVHARGSGAYGHFTLTKDLSQYSIADFLNGVGKKTEVFVRFSTVGGGQDSSDYARDPRGFAVKFYTKEGNYDIVGNNTPVFFVRDPIKFPDFIHSQKKNPKTNLPDPEMVYEYASNNPELLHQLTILMSDRGIPASYRHMHGFGSHTLSLWNDKKERVWVKWHFKTKQGIKCLTDEEASKMPAHGAQEDLVAHIEKGDFPAWDVKLQIMTAKQAETYQINPFDLTKVWPHSDFPLIEIGVMELNRNVDNYFAEVEQAAFAPSNLVPGVGVSPDKMLQGRLLAYQDAHRYRLGANHSHIPVNAPKCPFHNHQNDGTMTTRYNTDRFNFDSSYPEYSHAVEPSLPGSAEAIGYYPNSEDDNFTQARNLFNLMSADQKDQLGRNIAGGLSKTSMAIQERMLGLFKQVSEDYYLAIKKFM
jgi:catalase